MSPRIGGRLWRNCPCLTTTCTKLEDSSLSLAFQLPNQNHLEALASYLILFHVAPWHLLLGHMPPARLWKKFKRVLSHKPFTLCSESRSGVEMSLSSWHCARRSSSSAH
eukprot:6460550-Amphidinium_carterae.2